MIPSIPKPKSSVSPKLGRSTPTAQPEPSKPTSSADLLGLDTSKPDSKPSDYIFSSFFSAPQEPVEPPKETKPDLKTEEENFFKQPAPTEKEKNKLTKDSILALYSQTPSNLASQFTPSFTTTTQSQFNQPAQNQFNQQPTQNQFNQLPQNQFNQQPTQNQFNQAPAQNQFNQSAQNQFNQQAQNQFGFGNVFQTPAPAFNNMPAQNGMQQFNQFQSVPGQFQQPFGQPQQFNSAQSQPFPQNNQFFNQPQQAQPLSQQFGALALGQSFPNAFAPNANVASNSTWQ